MTVKWNELLESFEFASAGGMGENEAFLHRDIGRCSLALRVRRRHG